MIHLEGSFHSDQITLHAKLLSEAENEAEWMKLSTMQLQGIEGNIISHFLALNHTCSKVGKISQVCCYTCSGNNQILQGFGACTGI